MSAIALPCPIAADLRESKVHQVHMEASPENWSISDYITVGGLSSAFIVWFWKKPFKLLIDMMKGPGRIAEIDKKLDAIFSFISLSQEMSRVTWRAIDRPVWQSDANGMCVHANPFMLRLLGIQDDELLGEGWRNIIHLDDRDMVSKEWDSAVKSKRDFHLRYRWVNSNGDAIPIIANASRLLDHEGRLLGYVGFVTVLEP